LARGVMFLHQLLQAGLEDRAMTVGKGLELPWILFDAADGMTNRRQAGAGNEPHISASDDRYIHMLLQELSQNRCRQSVMRGIPTTGGIYHTHVFDRSAKTSPGISRGPPRNCRRMTLDTHGSNRLGDVNCLSRFRQRSATWPAWCEFQF